MHSQIQTQWITRKDPPLNVHGRQQITCQKRTIIGNPNTNCGNIQLRCRDGIWHRTMSHEGKLISPTRNNSDNTRIRRTEITRKPKWEEKPLRGRFKQLKSYISHKKSWSWQRKGKLKREIESLPIAAQNNATRTNYIKARIDKIQQNGKCRLCGDSGKTINHTLSKRSELAQKED